MKNYIIILFIFLLASCDPVKRSTFLIDNTLDEQVSIKVYSEDRLDSGFLDIAPKEQLIVYNVKNPQGHTIPANAALAKFLDVQGASLDSLIFTFEANSRLSYILDFKNPDELNPLQDLSWVKSEPENREFEYKFSITEAHKALAQ